MRITTAASGLEFDDKKLGPPQTMTEAYVALLLLPSQSRHLSFFVRSSDILCLEYNLTAPTYNDLVDAVFAALESSEPLIPTQSTDLWNGYFSSSEILRIIENSSTFRRYFIVLRGDVEYAKSI